jgi:hypothetical protein
MRQTREKNVLVTIRIDGNKGEFGKDTNRNNDKEFIQRLITQNKEQQNTIYEFSCERIP